MTRGWIRYCLTCLNSDWGMPNFPRCNCSGEYTWVPPGIVFVYHEERILLVRVQKSREKSGDFVMCDYGITCPQVERGLHTKRVRPDARRVYNPGEGLKDEA